MTEKPEIVVIGGGFTGLAAAYEISKAGCNVTVIEEKEQLGGLADEFYINGQPIEKFYHHWFKNDNDIIQLARELGTEDHLIYVPTVTGMYLQGKFYNLSNPLDVLGFKPLPFIDRIRFGSTVVFAKMIRNWKKLESITSEKWLIKICGRRVYDLIWKPLLQSKFGPYASQISAVWFWNKLVLRGCSRDKYGREILLYYKGGFQSFIKEISRKIISNGGQIHTNCKVLGVVAENNTVSKVQTSNGDIKADAVLATPSLEVISGMLENHAPADYIQQLRSVKYLANICLVLELKESLSEYYWLNICDPEFPYVGIIEHTNFQSPDLYGGHHIVYLSQYLKESDALYQMGNEDLLELSSKHLKRLFPDFDRSDVIDYNVFRSTYTQPVVEMYHSEKIPQQETPVSNFKICSMAQIYPEDRGTNYAVRMGRQAGLDIVNEYG